MYVRWFVERSSKANGAYFLVLKENERKLRNRKIHWWKQKRSTQLTDGLDEQKNKWMSVQVSEWTNERTSERMSK